jgi:stage IV sporulation protein FB
VLLGEPGRTQGDLHFGLFGIPVRIHPLFWLMAVIFGIGGSHDLFSLMIWVAAVLLGILVHEMGHALVIRSFGFRPWIVLYAMGGVACHNPGEVYRSKGNTHWGQILICIAGPAAGFLLAGALLLGLYLAGFGSEIDYQWPFYLRPVWMNAAFDPATGALDFTMRARFVNDLFFICTLWGFLNLLPVFPLDGGQIAREVLLIFNPRQGVVQSLVLSIFTAILLAVSALVKLHDYYLALLFGYLAYESFTILQSYRFGGRR